MKKIYLITIAALFLSPAISIAQSDSVMLHIDKFNTFTYTTDGILPYSNLSVISGSPYDSFFIIPEHSNNILNVTGLIGAENGEALLNRFSHPGHYQNRDHQTYFLTHLSLPKHPISFTYKYLYTDEYSDRYDSLWDDYKKNTKKSMTFDEEGLRHEHFTALRYQNNNLQLQAIYNWYRRWNATPLFFSPLLTCGHSFSPSLTYNKNNITLTSQWFINQHSEYYNHIDPVDFTDLSFINSMSFMISPMHTLEIKVQSDAQLSPQAQLTAGLSGNKAPVHWKLSGSVYSNYELSAQGYTSYFITPNFNCSLFAASNYIPLSRPYYFYEKNVFVNYKPISFRQNDLYSSFTYSDTLLLPISIKTWFNHISDPLWESVTVTTSDSMSIEQIVYKNGESVWGINGMCQFNFKSLHFDFNPSILIPVGDTKRRFAIKRLLDANLSYTPFEDSEFSISLKLQYRDKATLNYLVSNNFDYVVPYSVPSYTALYFDTNIPFIMPFGNSFITNASFFVNAGPIRLTTEQRVREHPFGNLIGPAVYAGLKGSFW